MTTLREIYTQRIKRGFVRKLNNLKIASMARQVAKHAPEPKGQPVAFFKASTGIDDLSWNSGFHLLASWGFRLQGIPVVYFACDAGMSKCVLGTNRKNVHKEPPCKSCVYQSKTLYTGTNPHWFTFTRDKELERALQDLSVSYLIDFQWKLNNRSVIASEATLAPGASAGEQSSRNEEIASGQRASLAMTLPLGKLCLPGLRWILRVHDLNDDEIDPLSFARIYFIGVEYGAEVFKISR